MDYLIFNSDGSIKIKSLSQFIQKGDDGTKSVFIGIEGKSSEDYTLGGVALLPDGETTVNLTGVASELNVDGTTYPGFTLTLTAAVTLYEGQVKLSFTAIDNNDHVLVSSQILLRINPSTIEQGQEFELPYAEMIQLLSSLNSYQIKYAQANLRYYPTLASANADIENLAVGQTVLVNEGGYCCFYYKNASTDESLTLRDKLNDYRDKIGFIVNPNGLTVGTTLSTTEINKLLCFVIYSGVVYRKDRVDGNYIQFVNDYQIINGSTSQNDIFGRAEFTVNKNTGQVETFTIASKNVYTKEQIDNQIYNKNQADGRFVHLIGDENIDGVKTFASFPRKSGTPTVEAELVNKGYVDNLIAGISILIPSDASSTNQLADKNWVLGRINDVAAYYITKNAAGDAFDTVAELQAATKFYSDGVERVPTKNDWCHVREDENHDDATTEYIYTGSMWQFLIVINEKPMNQDELDALHSGANSTNIGKLNGYIAGTQKVPKAQDSDALGGNPASAFVRFINHLAPDSGGNIDTLATITGFSVEVDEDDPEDLALFITHAGEFEADALSIEDEGDNAYLCITVQ